MFNKHITPCTVVITSLLVRDKPPEAPASVKQVYCHELSHLYKSMVWSDCITRVKSVISWYGVWYCGPRLIMRGDNYLNQQTLPTQVCGPCSPRAGNADKDLAIFHLPVGGICAWIIFVLSFWVLTRNSEISLGTVLNGEHSNLVITVSDDVLIPNGAITVITMTAGVLALNGATIWPSLRLLMF